ncbi:MAG TPA: 2-hydroxyhepta-2,4-diene-1,7-dioate isomerase, partial [Phnomibacter sp.]|nr:2-hydroxyhepta-2,4-diene-1,7-dioate isomerase [Phnomibacter sp.]
MIRLYKTDNGPVAEKAGKYYSLPLDWQGLLIADNLYQTLETAISQAAEATKTLAGNIEMPMTAVQELWACGVTYLRSRDGRQEESKDAGGGDFYARGYAGPRPEAFYKAGAPRPGGQGGEVPTRAD